MKEASSRQTNGIDSSSASVLEHLKSVSAINGLLGLAILYTLYFAQSLILLLLFSALVALLLSPWVAFLKRLFIPRAVSAVVLLSLLVMPVSFLSVELAEPAQKWAKLLPKLSVHLNEQIDAYSDEFASQQSREGEALNQSKKEQDEGFTFFGWFKNKEPEKTIPKPQTKPEDKNVVTEQIKMSSMNALIAMLSAAPIFIAQVLSCVILILFLLIFGPTLFEAFVQSLPSTQKKDRVIGLVNAIQGELSRYIITVSAINVLLGVATATALSLWGMEDALLWGALVGLLNFMPYLGAVFGVTIITLAGVVQYGFAWDVLIPVGLYLSFNLIESQFITPTVLGHRMKINPLVVMLWLLMCAWLWGVLGVLLSVPILVCIKLALAQLGICKNAISVIESGG